MPSGRPAREAEGRRPSEPGMTEVSSDRMSPKRLSARFGHQLQLTAEITKNALRRMPLSLFGLEQISMAAESTRW